MKGVFFRRCLLNYNYIIYSVKRSTTTATATTGSAGSRLGSLGFRTVAGFKPSVAFQAECGGRNHLLHRTAALGAFAGGSIGKLLAQFKLVITACTTVFVHRHDVSTPSFF